MKKSIILLVSALGAASIAGCAGDNGESATVESVAYICGIGSTTNVERYAGVIESGSDAKVEKDSDKKIAEILVNAGDTVSKDQVLFIYDKEQTDLNIQKAQIEIEQLQASVTSKQSEIATLQGEIDGGQLDADTKTSYTLQIQELNADITETNLSVKSKQAELEGLQNTLNNLEVKAPDEGVIQSVNKDENSNSSEETAFIVIRKTGAFRVKGYVNETNRGSLYEGMDVIIRSRIDDALKKASIKNIDLKNPVSSSDGSDMYGVESDDTASSSKYPFYVELDNTDGFIIGQHVYIEPDYGQGDLSENSMLLPSYYINEAGESAWVWARDGKERLEKRSITLGEYDSEMDAYEVKSGLSAEDYIAAPDDSLKAGMKCIEFDFSSDMPVDFTFDENNTDDFNVDSDSSQDTEIIEDIPAAGGPGGGFSPGMMNPMFAAPGVNGGNEDTDAESAETDVPDSGSEEVR